MMLGAEVLANIHAPFRRKSMSRIAGILALALGAAAAVGQEVYPLNQARKVEVTVNSYEGERWEWVAVDDLEDLLATVELPDPNDPDYGDERATAAQLSTIGSDRMELFGVAKTQVFQVGGFGGSRAYGGHSIFVQFVVPERVGYHVIGTLDLQTTITMGNSWSALGHHALQLRRVAGAVVWSETPSISVSYWSEPPELWSQWNSVPLDIAGELEPGVYELTLESVADFTIGNPYQQLAEQPPTIELAYAVVFTVSEPPPQLPCGDLDGDGDFDLYDVAALQECMSGPQ
jgi:hypothetical protein